MMSPVRDSESFSPPTTESHYDNEVSYIFMPHKSKRIKMYRTKIMQKRITGWTVGDKFRLFTLYYEKEDWEQPNKMLSPLFFWGLFVIFAYSCNGFVCFRQGDMEKEGKFYDGVMLCIRERQLVEPDDKILIALSGGADSVALLLVLLQAGFHCEAAHCNFHLRGV